MDLSKVVYESGAAWVYKIGPGEYEIYRNQTCGCAVRKMQVSWPNEPERAMVKAIYHCDRVGK